MISLGKWMDRLKITKSWILLILIILLLSIRYEGSVATYAYGLDRINNLTYDYDENGLTYYNDATQNAYSYNLDADIWDDVTWVNRSADYIYSFEHLLVNTVNITVTNNGRAFSNNFSVIFDEINSGQNSTIQIFDIEKIYNFNDTIYILHQDRPETSIKYDDEIFYHITRVEINSYGNGTFTLSYYTMDFFDSIIPGEYDRGNAGLTHLYETMEGKLIYVTIPAIYSFECNESGTQNIIKYEQAKGESYSPYIAFHETSSSLLIRFRVDNFNVTLQYFKFYEDRIEMEQEWEYSVFVNNYLGPQVFINETTVVISDYGGVPDSRIFTFRDGERRGTTWLYYMNLETGLVVPIEIPDHISRDGFQPIVYFIEYFDWILPVLTVGLIVIYIIERSFKLKKFIVLIRKQMKIAKESYE